MAAELATLAAIEAQAGTPAGWVDAIILWRDVHQGDLVLLDDCLIVAEKVNVIPKPWGDGTDFTAVDISHRLDNGHMVCSERHGDRLTAVRRHETWNED